jgi:hypothetical protein
LQYQYLHPALEHLQGHEWVAFVDESNSDKKCAWTYIGVVLVRAKDLKEVMDSLQISRVQTGCDSEIHFTNLNNRGPVELAKSWVMEANRNPKIKQIVNGIEISRLNSALFASNKEDSTIARFTRSTIVYGLLRFGGYEPVLGAVFFDSGNLEHDPWFSTNLISKIKEDPRIFVTANSVEFIDSDHRLTSSNPQLSNLIQLVDLTLGMSRQCMEMPSKKPQRNEVSQLILPTIEKITTGHQSTSVSAGLSINSTFSISFFPHPSRKHVDGSARFYQDRIPAMSKTSTNSGLMVVSQSGKLVLPSQY